MVSDRVGIEEEDNFGPKNMNYLDNYTLIKWHVKFT